MPPSSTDDNPPEAPPAPSDVANLPPGRQLSGLKRKEQEPRKKPSFKVVGHLVMAMKRFSDSLNPTYTYGKRTASLGSAGASKPGTDDAEAVSSGERKLDRPLSGNGRATSPDGEAPLKYAYSSHGHRFDFLLKPLPATEGEEAAAAAGKP